MLILSRRIGEQIVLPGLSVEVSVLGVKRGKVRFGISAPAAIAVRREEITPAATKAEGEAPADQHSGS